MQHSHRHPWVDQHSPLDRPTPALQKKKKIQKHWIINKEVKRAHSREGEVLWAHWRWGGAALCANFQITEPARLARLWQDYSLNTNTRTGCWRSNTRTTVTEISLFLHLNFFSLSLSACLIHYLLVHHLSL
jgi:hypothetical protein